MNVTASIPVVLYIATACASVSEVHPGNTNAPRQTLARWDYKLRRSLVDKNKESKPGTLSYMNPNRGKTTAATDLGLSIGYVPSVAVDDRIQWEYRLGVEHHKNTAPEKTQDTTLYGAAAIAIVGDLVDDGYSWLPSLALKYKVDDELGAKSWMQSLDLAVANKSLRLGVVHDVAGVGVLFEPTFGAEYEQFTDGGALGSSGQVGRGYAAINLLVLPLYRRTVDDKSLGERIQINTSYQYWADFAESTAIDTGQDDHELFQTGLRFFLDEDLNFGIGLDFVDGENPSEGKPSQQYIQLSLLVKV